MAIPKDHTAPLDKYRRIVASLTDGTFRATAWYVDDEVVADILEQVLTSPATLRAHVQTYTNALELGQVSDNHPTT